MTVLVWPLQDSPWQSASEHFLVWEGLPWQGDWGLCRVSGLSQTRLLFFSLFPQGPLQTDQELQEDQPPDTVKQHFLDILITSGYRWGGGRGGNNQPTHGIISACKYRVAQDKYLNPNRGTFITLNVSNRGGHRGSGKHTSTDYNTDWDSPHHFSYFEFPKFAWKMGNLSKSRMKTGEERTDTTNGSLHISI